MLWYSTIIYLTCNNNSHDRNVVAGGDNEIILIKHILKKPWIGAE